MSTLLTREEFNRQVFNRDQHKCVACGNPAKDAHHLIDRSLWTSADQLCGYFVDNGVSVCEKHHLDAEAGLLTPQELRKLAGIETTVIPSQLDLSVDYSKWGSPFRIPTRANAKYPSTSYLDISPNTHGDNCVVEAESFAGYEVVITVKMDGANVVLRNDSMGARNGDAATHRSFDMLKSIHAEIRHRIRPGIEVFAEWLYAKHSIHYTGSIALDSYLHVIAAYDTKWRLWLSWLDTVGIATDIGFPTVPVLTSGTYKPWEILVALTSLASQTISAGHEGIVIRRAGAFHYGQFEESVGKYVRPGHVQTDDSWSSGPIVRNDRKVRNANMQSMSPRNEPSR